jgi:hypothetical protein
MKILKRLEINSELVALVSEDIHLSLNWIGKARFMVSANQALSGKVVFKLGYAHLETFHSVFVGVVDSCIEVATGKWQVIARELTAALDGHYPLALRHVTLNDVLSELSALSGIKFVTPNQEYTTKKVPYFCHTGSATQQLQAIGMAFSIPDYIWHQQGDGSCYVGSYADSFWQDKTLDVPVHHAKSVDGNTITLPTLPALRPGVTINKKRITQLAISGSQMVAKW